MSGYNLGTAAGRIVVDGSGAAKGFKVAEAAAEGFFAVVSAKLDALERLSENLMKIGAVGAGGIGIATKSAADFEFQLSAIEAVSGSTADQMQRISDTALRLGKDTAFSATEAASAIEELVKAGIDVEDVINGAADAAVNLAAAGQISLPQAAEIAATAMNNFALSAQDMPKVADLIAGAANASAISVSEFDQSLRQVGAVASLTGMSFQDVAVAIAEMGNAGVKGSDAGTSLKTMLMNLNPVTNRQKETMQELGLLTFDNAKAMQELAERGIHPATSAYEDIIGAIQAYVEELGKGKVGTEANEAATSKFLSGLDAMDNAFFDAQGNVKSMSELQEILGQSMKGLTKEQQLLTLETLFGQDAIRAAAVMAREGAAGYTDMATAMGKVTAADVAATRMDNLKGSIEQLKGSIETIAITIGNYFLPIVTRVIDFLNKMAGVFLDLPEGVQKFIAIFLGAGSALAFFTGLVIKLGFILVPLLAKFLGFTALKSVFSIFTTGFAALRSGAGIMAAVGAAASRAVTVFGRFGKILVTVVTWALRFRGAFLLLTGPLGWVIAAVGVLIGLGIALYKNWQPFHDLVDKVAGVIKNAFNTAIQELIQYWKVFVYGFKTGRDQLAGVLGFFQNLGRGARMVWEALKQLGAVFMANVIPALKQAGGTLLQSLIDAWHTLQPALVQVYNAFMTMGNTISGIVVPAVVALAKFLWPIIKVIGIVVGVIIGALFFALYKVAMFIVSTVLPVLIKLVAWFIGTFVKVLVQVATWIIQYLITPFIKFITFLVTTVIPAVIRFVVAVAQAFWGFVTTVTSIFLKVLAVITWPFRTIMSVVIPIVMAFVSIVVAIFKGLFGLLAAIANLIWQVVSGIFKIGVAAITFILKAMKVAIVAIWNSVMAIVIPIVTKIWSWIQEKWNALKVLTAAVWASIKNSVIRPVGQFVSDARSKLQSMWNTVSAIFGAIVNIISSKINSARQFVQNGINAIRNLFSGAHNWLVSAGRNVVQGLINGITSKFSALTRKVQSLANSIKDKVAGVLRIFSPSRVMMGMGRNVTEGLAIGIEQQQAMLTRAAEKIGNGLISTIGDYQTKIPPIVPPSVGLSRAVTPSAPAEGEGDGRSVTIQYKIYNPVAEPSSVTTTKESTRLAQLGVLS